MKYKRKAVYKSWNGCDFIELVEWKNGIGFDVFIGTTIERRISITWEEFKVLKKAASKLEKYILDSENKIKDH